LFDELRYSNIRRLSVYPVVDGDTARNCNTMEALAISKRLNVGLHNIQSTPSDSRHAVKVRVDKSY